MKRTTSLAAAVTAAAIIATPVGANAVAATSAPTAVVATQQAAALPEPPALESFAPDPLKILALPFSNFELIRTSAFVVTGYKTNAAGQLVDKNDKPLREKDKDESDAAYAKYVAENRVAITANIFQAVSDAVNKSALRGDFATAAAQIQSYLAQLAAQVIALPAALINLNVGAFFPKPAKTATASGAAATSADASPVALPSVGSLLTVAGIPLKNLDQARLAAFVTVGYKKNDAGQYVGKDGKPLTEGQTKEKDGVPLSANIFQAVSDAVNKQALKGDFAGAAKAIQGYLTELAGNVIALPGQILQYDLAAIGAVVPGLPASKDTAADRSSSAGTAPEVAAKSSKPLTKTVVGGASEAAEGASPTATTAPGGAATSSSGTSQAPAGRDLIGAVRDLFDRPDKAKQEEPSTPTKPEATTEPETPKQSEPAGSTGAAEPAAGGDKTDDGE
ncbi:MULTISPECIES: hypothetical protein [Tsukamurella]|uniref:PE-PPE domain-containing protein n=2 Tax=Tsukamurella TaxID=2060 RepID=A0A5C5S705_9ACTN|nr:MULTISPECIES: hypothetical protein [Tsukamurella]NMD55082.1 hypothetical protein [Tsukamurella columbiensis]TWS30111.1 hypothetical protein FK530_06235 [Tsukamurella conjunctivitidis]